ncbi:hypothetical protein ACFFTM_20365 [Pseudoduganella plicata]|uniref:Uncharacterized protein n=1 Tax=Pseudoduganella plicata TaxID=321984 RepID=A0A4P7BGP5_9BURK|nr:hypothetical protein [Pseudoduganella plicata]QBQ37217.1 hypothetical protein E1742_14310 [Pseudoduganella plicata]GGY98457.1 hypothetical protein GCM10007388_34940 [Pseudoduganella plicata]
MKTRTRYRLALYGAELLLIAALAGALAAWPQAEPLSLSIGALLLHLTTSIGMWPFEFRYSAIPPSDHVFGVRLTHLFTALIALGFLAMLSWIVAPSQKAWVTGLVLIALAVEGLVLHAAGRAA